MAMDFQKMGLVLEGGGMRGVFHLRSSGLYDG